MNKILRPLQLASLFLISFIAIEKPAKAQQAVDVYLHDGITYQERLFDYQMQMKKLDLQKRSIENAEKQQQQQKQNQYNRQLAEEVSQVYNLYYKALNGDIPDLVISGTCGVLYDSVYNSSHPIIKEALEKTRIEDFQKIISKIPNVNRSDANLTAKGTTMFAILACAQKGNDNIQVNLPIVKSMGVEIQGLLDNQSTRELSFGGSIYKDWNNYYRQMKDASLTPLTPSEKKHGLATQSEAQKKFKTLVDQATAAGVPKETIYKALIPISKKINTSWGGFNNLVEFRESEFNRMVLEAAGGNTSKRADIFNNTKIVEKIRNYIDAVTVYKVCISDFPQSDELRVPAEEAITTLIKEAQITGPAKKTEEVDLTGDDLEKYKKISALLYTTMEMKVPYFLVDQKLSEAYDSITPKFSDNDIKIRKAFTDAFDHYSKEQTGSTSKPSKESLIKASRRSVMLMLCKQSFAEGALARDETIKALEDVIAVAKEIPEKISQYKKTLDQQDQSLYKALNISTNNPTEIHKVDVYFIGKLAKYYEEIRTNEFFPAVENARQEYMNQFINSVGLKNMQEFSDYCNKQSISTNDINCYINGNAINQAAYYTTPMSDYARSKYIEKSEECIKNTNGFFTGPYESWDTFKELLQKRYDYLKANASANK